MYLFNPKYLESYNGLELIPRARYMSGAAEDRFDSFHFLHLLSRCSLTALQKNVASPYSNTGFFLQSRGESQSALAARVVDKYDKTDFDLMVHCHATHPEDLNKCQISWLQHRRPVKVKYAFAVEYGGGMNIPLALNEIMNLSTDSNEIQRGIMVASERVLSPIGRRCHPMGWLSDGAAAVEFGAHFPEHIEKAYRIESLTTDYSTGSLGWVGSDRENLIRETLSLLDKHLHQVASDDEEIIYPAYDHDILELFQSVRMGMAWKMGLRGMSFGGEHLAWLARDQNTSGKVRLVFMEPARHVASVLLTRIVQ